MAASADEVVHKVSRSDADLLTRGWNLLYNRCLSYSFQHPLVQETLPKVHALFDQALKNTGTLNILLQEAMFFVDSRDVMYQPNNRRISDHLRRFGLESITFLPAMGMREFGHFIDACSLIHPNADSFARFLRDRGVTCIEINKVSLRAVKDGEELVASGTGRGGPGDGSGTGATGNPGEGGSFQDVVMRAVLGRLTSQEMEGNVLLAQMLSQPDSLGRAVVEGIETQRSGTANGAENVGDMLMSVLSQFAQSSRTSGHSLDELLSGLYSMRSEMISLLRSQKSLDETLSQDEIQDTADDAFDRTVCQIAADDWAKSSGNSKRMATVLTRVVPGRKELKRLLPKLKETLLAKGMTLQQWYGLVGEISNLFGVEKAMDQLAGVAAEFGVTAEEIVGELNRDARSAARLILASAEIRKAGGENAEEHMIESLLEAVDRASEKMADSAELHPRNAATMALSIANLKNEVGQELSTRAMDQNLRQAVLKKLEHRSNRAVTDLKARAFVTQLRNPDISPEEKSGLLGELATQESDLDSIMETALSLVGEDEIAKQIARDIVGKVREKLRMEKEKRAGSDLPQGVYPRAVAEFFLRYELRRAHRYDVPFTTMLISFQGLPESPEALKAHESPLRSLSNMLAGELRLLLRDVDFVGHLGFNRYFIVLPMTPYDNALHVLKKFKDHLSRQVALPTGEKAWVRPRVGMIPIVGGQKMSLSALYEATSRKWQEDL
ncbi:MAG: hypothetical protein RL318_1626 [Fibrobacterota bacterium]|jgi:hypothetical protein